MIMEFMLALSSCFDQGSVWTCCWIWKHPSNFVHWEYSFSAFLVWPFHQIPEFISDNLALILVVWWSQSISCFLPSFWRFILLFPISRWHVSPFWKDPHRLLWNRHLEYFQERSWHFHSFEDLSAENHNELAPYLIPIRIAQAVFLVLLGLLAHY